MAPPPADSSAPDPRPASASAPTITVPSPRELLHHHHHLVDRRDTPRGRAWEPERSRRGEAMDGAAAAKLVPGEAGYVLEDVPHVSDYLPDLPTYPNPLQDNPAYSVVKQYFVNPDDTVCQKIVVHKDGPRGNHFRRAGPRQRVYVIGGDGTQRGAGVIFEEVRRRGLKVSVAGIPKTIDNDIPVIDKSFGFDTAVEEAQRAINAAHVEAVSAENGIGLVKLMGRHSGFIAHYATLASRDVDCCLIPESPFYLEGEGGLFKYIEKRLKDNGHMVIVVAEGAGQKLIAETMQSIGKDASGNELLLDVGLWLSQKINEYFKKNKMTINLKYIDPTYMIRAIPSNASDNVYCTLLAHSVVHGAMAGYTGFTIGQVNGRHCYIPFYRITEKQNRVSITDRMWARLLSSTNQPSFLCNKVVEEAKKEQERTAQLIDGSPSHRKVDEKVAGFNSGGTK
ncbi:unnamed protein product [Urochloa humidicola]